MKRIKPVWLLLCVISPGSFAQSEVASGPLSLSAYIETFYTYDFANPPDQTRPDFFCSYHRHNEVNLNLGFVKASYETGKVRANLALMAGTYANANLSEEPGVLKNIFEANAGLRLSKNKNLWIDGGIFPSHIGFESAVGIDCWNLTRSLLADNSPYYESGIKLSYSSDNDKWFLSGLVLNGWQRIQRQAGNTLPASGHQLIFKPDEKLLFNSSSFIGSEAPDSVRRMRYFHNFYSQVQLYKSLGIIIGFDIGAQQKSKHGKAYDIWYAPVLILKYSPTEKLHVAARGEYYSDANGAIIPTQTPHGFQTFGYSVNLDYRILNNATWRIEGRGLKSKDDIFFFRNRPDSRNFFISTALCVSF